MDSTSKQVTTNVLTQLPRVKVNYSRKINGGSMISATLEGDINGIEEFEEVSNVMFSKVEKFIKDKIAATSVDVIQGVFPGAQEVKPPTTDKKCFKCGADMKISAKSGKPYCSKLCWKQQNNNIPF